MMLLDVIMIKNVFGVKRRNMVLQRLNVARLKIKGVTKLTRQHKTILKNNLLVRANMALENAKAFNNKEKIVNRRN